MTQRANVVVIGDLMLDKWHLGHVTRMSPEAPDCPVVERKAVHSELGGAANVGAWLASLVEHPVTLLGSIACDTAAKEIFTLCSKIKNLRLVTDHCFDGDLHLGTTCKERYYAWQPDRKWRQYLRLDHDTQTVTSSVDAETTITYLQYLKPDLVVVADYDKGVFQGPGGVRLRDWLGWECGFEVVVNAKRPGKWASYPLTTLLCNEAEAASANLDPERSDVKMAPLATLVVTRGQRGATAYYCDPEHLYKPSPLREPSRCPRARDVTGAGDAFTAGYAARYLERLLQPGESPGKAAAVREMVSFGQECAARCCASLGCGAPGGASLTDLVERLTPEVEK